MKKKPYEMSNRELQEANNRLQLENTYKNNTSYKGVGKKFVDRFEQTSVQKSLIWLQVPLSLMVLPKVDLC